jgi:hypothetical protein
MKPFIDYAYYTSVYKGTLPEVNFSRFVMIATQKIKAHTFGRINENAIPEEVKYCACVLTDKISAFSKNENKASESVSSWSITFRDSRSNDEIISETIKEFLAECKDENGTPLLYRGC